MSEEPTLTVISDPADPRLGDYVRLRETSLRRSLESEQGLFIAEGQKVITRACEAGYRPRSFLLAERWVSGLSDVIVAAQSAGVASGEPVPVYVLTEQVAEAVTGFHVHRGALASMHRTVRHSVDDLLGFDRLVVLEDVVDHTNVGAILRNAAGLGWDGALLAPRAADPLYRRSIKVSMGAVFSLPWARLTDWHGAIDLLRSSGFTTVAMALRPDAVDLQRLAADLAEVEGGTSPRIALLLGTEGEGLSSRWVEAADVVAQIPMTPPIDSLNVAASAAIACYALGSASS